MYLLSTFTLVLVFSTECAFSIGNWEECGTLSNGIISEDRSKWPWHATLFRKKPRNKNAKISPNHSITYSCGGTLVNRNTVLTSASCVSDHDTNNEQLYPVELQMVILAPAGSDFISNADDPNSQLFKVDTVIRHPDFDFPTLSNNIAVIKLQLEATINDYVRPICFPYNTSKDFEITKYQLEPGRNGMLAGFGLDWKSGNMSNLLKEFDFSIESDLDCYNDFSERMKPGQFCAGYNGFIPLIKSKGGGLVFPVPQPKLQFYIQGIVCHGTYHEKSALKFLGSKSNIVLIKVAAFTDWILPYLETPTGDIRSNFQMPQHEDDITSTVTMSTTSVGTTPALTTTAITTTTRRPMTTTITKSMTTTTATPTTTTEIIATSPQIITSEYSSTNTNKKPNISILKPGKENSMKCPPLVPVEDSNVEVTCVLPSENDEYSVNKSCETETFVGVRASFACKPYYKRTVNNPFFSKICQPNGQWSHNDKTFSCDLDCGISDKVTEKMIVNGNPSSTRKWPWHAAIFRKTSGTFQYICGGALIQMNVVVTASHCLTDDAGGRMDANLYQVVLGAISSDLSENYEDKQPQIFRISEIYTHPQYNYVNANADIALLTLKNSVKISKAVHPVCFPYTDDDSALTDSMLSPGSYGVIAGFGFDESWKMSSQLRELQMPVVSYRDCSKVLGMQYIPTTQFCAGYVNGSSPCEGDSGGALVRVFPSDTIPVHYYIQGIVSYGTLAKNTKRCDNNKYTIFTRVASFNSWVTDKLRDIYSVRR